MDSHLTTMSQAASQQRANDATATSATWTFLSPLGAVFRAARDRAVLWRDHRLADGDGH